MSKHKKNTAIFLTVLSIISFAMTFISVIFIKEYTVLFFSLTFICSSLLSVVLVDEKYLFVRYLISPAIILSSLYVLGDNYYLEINSLIANLFISYLLVYLVYSFTNDKELGKILSSRQSILWKISLGLLLLSIILFKFLVPVVSSKISFYIGIILLLISIMILFYCRKSSIYYRSKRKKNFHPILIILIDINSFIILALSTYLIVKYIPYVFSNLREVNSFIQDDNLRVKSHLIRYIILEILLYIYIFTIQFRYGSASGGINEKK